MPRADPTLGTIVFYLLAALVVAGAAGVAFSRNILRSAFFLLATLAGTAGLYLTLGADFVGIVQLLVYVGGILVLLLFAVLLTNKVGEVRLSNASLGRAGGIPVAAVIAVGLGLVLVRTPWPRAEPVAAPATVRLGDAFLREHLLPFELLSVVLLAALVGAMVIARRAVRDHDTPPAP